MKVLQLLVDRVTFEPERAELGSCHSRKLHVADIDFWVRLSGVVMI